MLHGGAVDTGDGNYTVSAWPVVAGAYHMSVLVSALEPSRWALGYRQEYRYHQRDSQQQAWQHMCFFTTPSAAKRFVFGWMKRSSLLVTATREIYIGEIAACC